MKKLLCKIGIHKYRIDDEKFIAFCSRCQRKWHASSDMFHRETIIGKRWDCNYACGVEKPYGFVPEADCPIHDPKKI